MRASNDFADREMVSLDGSLASMMTSMILLLENTVNPPHLLHS
jgi:hypothetical protein